MQAPCTDRQSANIDFCQCLQQQLRSIACEKKLSFCYMKLRRLNDFAEAYRELPP